MKKAIKTGIAKKSTRDLSIKRLKLLTKYIITRNEKILDRLLQYDEHYQSLINRAFSYFIPFPKVINYLNTYLNHTFDHPQRKDFKKWLITFSEIARLYGINSTNDLYYSRFKISDRESFYKLITEYYNTFNLNVSSAETTALFLLYNNQIITEQHINEMKNMISGKDSITESQKKLESIITPQPFSNTRKETKEEVSLEIKQFTDSAKAYIKNRPVCKGCSMYSRGSVILDTNVNVRQPVDISFIGLNPGYNEFKEQKLFVGESGQLLHKFIDPLVVKYNLSYIITNAILCWSKNSSEITNITSVVKNCKQLTDEIHKTFPSKIKVFLGADSMKAAGIKGGITKMNGQMYDNNNFIIFHPSAILRDPRKLSKFETAFLNLEEHVKNINTYKSSSSTTTYTDNVKFSIPKDAIITQFDKSLTLFDVQVIGENVVYIMADPNGNKKYLLEPVQFPVHLKYGNYTDCEYISDKVDNVVYLTAQERKLLNQKMYYDLRNKTNLNPK